MKIITKNEKQTIALAKKIARELKGGEIIALIGDLGSGKTIFTKGIAQGLGIKKIITSPTFVLMKLYKTQTNTDKNTQVDTDGRCNSVTSRHLSVLSPRKSAISQCNSVLSPRRSVCLCHIDAYRIKNEQELIDIGILDYFNQPDTVCVIEWADKIKHLLAPTKILPKKIINVKFKCGQKKNERIVKIEKK